MMETSKQAPSSWNVPNALTVLRILMVPLFLWLLLAQGGQDPVLRLWAFGIFCLAMITDWIDGTVARKYGLITDFGKIADPIADKALMSAAFIGLAIIGGPGSLPWWVPVIILVREYGITVMRLIVVKKIVLPASKGGKIKTVLQTVAVGLLLLVVPVGHLGIHGLTIGLLVVAWVILVAAIVQTLWSGMQYVVDVGKALKQAG